MMLSVLLKDLFSHYRLSDCPYLFCDDFLILVLFFIYFFFSSMISSLLFFILRYDVLDEKRDVDQRARFAKSHV